MSTITRFNTEKATVWSAALYDPNNPYAAGFANPRVIDTHYTQGGDLQRDDAGAEFTPGTVYVTKSDVVVKGDRIAVGEHTETTPTSGAETVRKVQTGTPIRGTRDYKIYTS